jgi:hypothetical protein
VPYSYRYYGMTLVVTRIYQRDTNDDDEDDVLECSFKYGIIFGAFAAELVGALVIVP